MMARMNYKAIAPLVLAAAIAFAQPVAFIAQEAGKAAEILAAARKAIGDKKLDALKTFSVQSALRRNVQSMQLTSDVEILLDLPDKYLRSEVSGGGMMLAGGGVSGFNGDRSLQKLAGGHMAGGGNMMIRIGGPGGSSPGAGEKPTPEQREQMNEGAVRGGQVEASRFMLGWFAMAHPAISAQYAYAGAAESPDGKAYVIDVKGADNFAARLFIDQMTHLPVMVTYKGPQPRIMTRTAADGNEPVQAMQKPPALADYTLFFDDWREGDGVKFPFKMRRAMGSETTEEWTVSKIKVNPKIDPKRFVGES
jgi:hypothetical protein